MQPAGPKLKWWTVRRFLSPGRQKTAVVLVLVLVLVVLVLVLMLLHRRALHPSSSLPPYQATCCNHPTAAEQM
jgi:hypothetical protein